MSGLALLLCLASALAWGLFDTQRKLLARSLDSEALVIRLCLGMVPLAAAAVLLEGAALPSMDYLLPGLITLALGIVANLLFMHSLRVSPLSLTIPFLSLVPAFSVLGAFLLLGEKPSLPALFGIGLVAISALLINGGQGVSLWRALLNERGSVMMCGVALLWAMTSVLDKKCLTHSSIAQHVTLQNLGIGGTLLLRRRLSGKPMARLDAGSFRGLLLAIVCGLGALSLQLAAIQLTQVSLMETLKRVVGLLMALMLGRILFGETLRTHTLWAAAGMVLGVILVVGG